MWHASLCSICRLRASGVRAWPDLSMPGGSWSSTTDPCLGGDNGPHGIWARVPSGLCAALGSCVVVVRYGGWDPRGWQVA